MPESAKTIIRSRKCGFKDVYVAKVKTNTSTAYETDTPYKLARGISAKITDKFNREKVYSDDGVEDVIDSYEETEVELEVSSLAPQDYATLFDNLYDKGFLVKGAEDKAQEVALGYRCKQRNGKYEFVWLYTGVFERPEQSETTKKEKVEVASQTLKGSFYQRNKVDTINNKEINAYQVVVDESNLVSDDTDAKTAIEDWFSKVQEYKAQGV